MAYSRKFLIKAHRRLWDWLAKNPEASKRDWPEWETNDGKISIFHNECSACEWLDQKSSDNRCLDGGCLFIWRGGSCIGLGEFEEYVNAISPGQKIYWAEKIRDLEVNPLYTKGLTKEDLNNY